MPEQFDPQAHYAARAARQFRRLLRLQRTDPEEYRASVQRIQRRSERALRQSGGSIDASAFTGTLRKNGMAD
jgi:hypothetical protein